MSSRSAVPPTVPEPDAPTSDDVWVICLCAQWCHQCRDLQPAFSMLHRDQPDVRWVWVDIEDHSEMVEALDIETFPTYLVVVDDEVKVLAPGPTNTDALNHFVRLHASSRSGHGLNNPPLWAVFQAIRSWAQGT